MAEPDWMNQIQSETVCNFFYAFFILYAIMAILALAGTVGVLAFMKLPKGLAIGHGFYGAFMVSLAATQALFFYLICDRALKPNEATR